MIGEQLPGQITVSEAIYLEMIETLRERLAAAIVAACPHENRSVQTACACCRRSARIVQERP
jgi:hypothetical protein